MTCLLPSALFPAGQSGRGQEYFSCSSFPPPSSLLVRVAEVRNKKQCSSFPPPSSLVVRVAEVRNQKNFLCSSFPRPSSLLVIVAKVSNKKHFLSPVSAKKKPPRYFQCWARPCWLSACSATRAQLLFNVARTRFPLFRGKGLFFRLGSRRLFPSVCGTVARSRRPSNPNIE